MPNKSYDASGVVLMTTYLDPTVAVGGTDVTADQAGVIWGWLYVGDYSYLDVDVAVTFTGGASPGVTINVDRALADTVPGPAQTFGSNVATAVQTGNGTKSYTIGPGASTNTDFGRYCRITWTGITGAPTNLSFIVSVIGKV